MKPELYPSLQRGDSNAWQQLYEERFGSLTRFAISLGVNEFWAEDIVQEAMLKFSQALPNLNVSGNVDGYLSSMVRNLSMDYHRRNSVRPSTVDIEPHEYSLYSDEQSVEDQTCMKQGVEYVLNLVSDRAKPVFIDFALGYKLNEITERNDLSMATVKGVMFRERNKFREADVA